VTASVTDRLQQTRWMVVEVDREQGRLRVKGEACTDLSCHAGTIVVAEDGRRSDLSSLYPGDIVRIEEQVDAGLPVMTIVVLRRVWEGISSPEL
jgi:hypothetical protein